MLHLNYSGPLSLASSASRGDSLPVLWRKYRLHRVLSQHLVHTSRPTASCATEGPSCSTWMLMHFVLLTPALCLGGGGGAGVLLFSSLTLNLHFYNAAPAKKHFYCAAKFTARRLGIINKLHSLRFPRF